MKKAIAMVVLFMFLSGCAFNLLIRLSNPFEDRPTEEGKKNEFKVTVKLG